MPSLSTVWLVRPVRYVHILNWTGNLGFDDGSASNDRLLSASDPGLSQTDLANFNFYSDGGTNLITAGGTEFVYGNMFEIVAVPEPSTWFAAALALSVIGFSQRKRLRACASPAAEKASNFLIFTPMPPKTDPYATPLHRRIDAFLCIFSVVVAAMVFSSLRTDALARAHGGTEACQTMPCRIMGRRGTTPGPDSQSTYVLCSGL